MTKTTPSQETDLVHPALADGRQSDKALAIARGVRRHLQLLGFQSLTEFSLPNGRRADIAAVSDGGEIWIIEIKSSIEDFRADNKWPEYQEFADKFFFAVDGNFPIEILPENTGLMIADRFGGDTVRPAEKHPLAAARRKALTLRIARTACQRLHNLADPDATNETFRQI